MGGRPPLQGLQRRLEGSSVFLHTPHPPGPTAPGLALSASVERAEGHSFLGACPQAWEGGGQAGAEAWEEPLEPFWPLLCHALGGPAGVWHIVGAW